MRVVVTSRRFPEQDPYGDIVAKFGGELIYGNCKTEADAIALCENADVIIGGFVPITERVMDAAESCAAILLHSTGYDSVDVQTATYRGIPVCNTPGYAPDDIASHAMTLALAAAHDVAQHDRRMREQNAWDRTQIDPLFGKTMGIVGFGQIGRKLVPKARGFDMDVIAYDPYVADDIVATHDVELVSFDALLERSDCISIHTPLTTLTHHRFSRNELVQMRDSAILVNTARGPIVDESALDWALKHGELRAAGIDVFEHEPPTNSPLMDNEDVVLTPHVAGGTQRAQDRVLALMQAELRRCFEDAPLQHVINPSVYQYTGGQVTRPDNA